MAFCVKCGEKLNDGVKFCVKCGTPVAGAAPAAPAPAAPRPATEKVGNIRKCPACGAEVGSFQARCPSCGHELNSVDVGGSVKEFAQKLVELESGTQSKADQKQANAGLRVIQSMATATVVVSLIFYVLDGEFNYLIPLGGFALTALFALILFGKVKLTPAQKKETMFIETFPVPSTREDLLEFLILAASKTSSASGFGHEAQLQRHWNKIWNVKCRQVSLKADLAFAGDTQSLSTVNNLLAKVNEVITRQKRHAGILAGAIVAVILAASGAAGFFALGLNIKVPESVTIAPENVEVLGPFASVIKVAGSGVTMRSIDKGTGVAMSIEFEVTEDPVAYEKARVQEEIKNIISEQKWGARDVISYEPRGTYFDIPDIRHDSLGKIFDSICKLEPGTVKKFDIPLNEFRGSTTEKKKTTVKLMSAKTLQINTHSAGRVENKTRKDAGKSWTDYQKDFTLK